MGSENVGEVFRIERRGEIILVVPSPEVESLSWDLIEQVGSAALEPIRNEKSPLVLVDLSEIDYFGSIFLSVLLRCWQHVSTSGGTMLLCNASPKARELLRVTAMDTLWAIYESREEAMQVLHSE